jgi:polyhydroxybutyrate depolymerase
VAASPAADADACTPARPRAPGDYDEALTSGGIERAYTLHIPGSYEGVSAAPLIVGFHSFASFSGVYAAQSGLAAAADGAGAIVVFPQGLGEPPRWNDRKDPDGADDVAFVGALLDALGSSLCIDANRTYMAGYSNGGGMAVRVACEMPDRVAAVGVVAATYNNCHADAPLIAFHGLDDAIVPFEGGPPDPRFGDRDFLSVRRSVSEWARTAGCGGLPIISRPSAEVELSTFNGCRGGDGEVLLYSIVTGGHGYPGSDPLPVEIVGHTTQEIDATETIVGFFRQHPPTDGEAAPPDDGRLPTDGETVED